MHNLKDSVSNIFLTWYSAKHNLISITRTALDNAQNICNRGNNNVLPEPSEHLGLPVVKCEN